MAVKLATNIGHVRTSNGAKAALVKLVLTEPKLGPHRLSRRLKDQGHNVKPMTIYKILDKKGLGSAPGRKFFKMAIEKLLKF